MGRFFEWKNWLHFFYTAIKYAKNCPFCAGPRSCYRKQRQTKNLRLWKILSWQREKGIFNFFPLLTVRFDLTDSDEVVLTSALASAATRRSNAATLTVQQAMVVNLVNVFLPRRKTTTIGLL